MDRPSLIDELQGLADALAARIHQSVAVDDAAGRLLAVSRHYGDADEYRMILMLERKIPPAYREFFAPYLAHGAEGPIHVPGNDELSILPRIGYRIYIEGQLVAFLWFMDLGRELQEELIESYLSRMRELLAERLDKGSFRDAGRQSQLFDLISGRPTHRESLMQFEAPEGVRHCFAVVSYYCDDVRDEFRAGADAFMRDLPDYIIDHGFRFVGSVEPDGLSVAVYRREVGNESDLTAMIDRFALAASSLCGDEFRGPTRGSFGLSELGDITAVRELYAQSVLAAFLGHHLGGPDPLLAWPQIKGLARSLTLPPGTPQSAGLRMLESMLLDEDGFAFETIGALLHSGAGIGEAAKLLSVHRTTMHYRIQQLQGATGVNLQMTGHRFLAFDLWLRIALTRSSIGHLVEEIQQT
ncbi:helix-turn-helix domain-containing protein [Leucobacter sp. gxy201]|uniref:helix-turn-helix domain-containing protein n=1 Tax=Leucobacter sp. gxy201 TaxID=2957200 RepID=UPI003DA19055